MKKINLFFILAFKDQTYVYDKKIQYLNQLDHKKMYTTITLHFWMLSKYFNLYNFFEYEDKIEQFDNAVIYHLPYGKDDIGDDIEKLLLKYKGKIPIVMRSYDAHSPLKLSSYYLDTYHDLALTYLQPLVNNQNRLFAQISYDNHLIKKYNNIPSNRKFGCIILRKETRKGYFESRESFKEINITKTYEVREIFAKYKQIDVYGANWPFDMTNYKGALVYAKKHYTQSLYKFNFIIENAITDNYLSEKIFDTFLSLSVPVYLGSPVVVKYIPKECFIDIRDFNDNNELINYLENMPNNEYNRYIENILKYRDELFDNFSTKTNFVLPVYKWYKKNYNNDLKYSKKEFNDIDKNIINTRYKGITLVENTRYFYAEVKLFVKRVIL